jgi:hypothetical protein
MNIVYAYIHSFAIIICDFTSTRICYEMLIILVWQEGTELTRSSGKN